MDNGLKPQLVLNLKSKNAAIYYGIFISDREKIHEDLKLVFTDKAECLAILKTIQGARFKSFSSESDAQKFVKYGPLISCSTPDSHKETKSSVLIGEKPSPFRGPKSQDLVKFRKAIEKGNIDFFEECINSNPRYLVSCGDTPSILQEGSRYNALHIACRHNQTNLCQRVLSTVSKEDFFQKLYPDDSIESSKRRSQFLLDLYLNTPDKGFNETPLHFACKHGSVGCVKVLVSYVACDKNRTNKYNEKPVEIICSRDAKQNKASIEQIENLLGELYYIPVLRDEDNCLPPQIGAPCSSNESINFNSNLCHSIIGPPSCSSSPVSPSFKVRGYAGPMSPQKAESFHCRWKHSMIPSPFKNLQSQNEYIRIADHEKGLERIGRDLASEFRVDWLEYWDFLGSFAKLSSEDGLRKLEKHLQNQYKKIVMERNFEDLSHSVISVEERLKEKEVLDLTNSFCLTDSSFNSLDVTQFSSTSIGEICRGLEALRLNMSLSPNPKTGSSSFNSNLLFETNQSTPDNKLSNESYLEEDVLSSSYLITSPSIASLYNFVIQSISISSERLLTILTEAADRLELHVGPNFNVTLNLKAKIRKEIIHLRQAIVSHLLSQSNKKYDLSFVHILLAANVSILLPENVTEDKIHLLLKTIIDLRKNIEFFEGSSSEEEDTFCDTTCDVNSTTELECVVKAFEQSLTIINNLTKSGVESKLNKSDLGSCTCLWDPVGGGTLKLPNNEKLFLNSSTESIGSYKYSHAHSFLSKILLSETPSEAITKRHIFNDYENLNQSYIAAMAEEDSNQDEDDAESFVSAASSVDDAGMVTPEEAINVYINGAEPSKVDVDVLLALDGTEIDSEKYPYTYMWQKLVSSKPSQVRDSWDSPCCRRRLTPSRNSLTKGNLNEKRPRNLQFNNVGESPKS